MDHHVLHRPLIPLQRRRRPSSKANFLPQDDENNSFYNRGNSQERWQSSDTTEEIEEKANTPVAQNRKTFEDTRPKSPNQNSGMPESIFRNLALEAVAKRQRQRDSGAEMAINNFIKATKSESSNIHKKMTIRSSFKERLQTFEKISKAPMTKEQESLTRRISTGSTRSSIDCDEGTPLPLTGMIGILKKTNSEHDIDSKIVTIEASSKVSEVAVAESVEPKIEFKSEVEPQVSQYPKAIPALERRSDSDVKTPDSPPSRANISAVKFHLPSASEDRLSRRVSSNLSSSDEDDVGTIFMKQDHRGRKEHMDSLIFLNGRAGRILVQAIRDKFQALSVPFAGIASFFQPLSQLKVIPLETSRHAVLFWLTILWLLWCFVIALLVTVRRYPPKQ